MGYQLSGDAAPGAGAVHGMKTDFHHISAHYKIGLRDHLGGLCIARTVLMALKQTTCFQSLLSFLLLKKHTPLAVSRNKGMALTASLGSSPPVCSQGACAET